MASKKEIMKKLNERKKVLVEILDDYNKYYVDIVNKVLEGRYAGLGMCAAQESASGRRAWAKTRSTHT